MQQKQTVMAGQDYMGTLLASKSQSNEQILEKARWLKVCSI